MTLKMKTLARVATFLALITNALIAYGQPSELLGVWVVDNDRPLWKARIVVEPDRISLGSPDCQNLPYLLIREVSLGPDGEVYALDIAAPPDKCRGYNDEKVIWHLRVKHGEKFTYMYLDTCPSIADLELLMQGKNRGCSGTYFATKETDGDPNAR